MRHLHSEFHFRHALFALQGPDGYVEALLEAAREPGAKQGATMCRSSAQANEPVNLDSMLFAVASPTEAQTRYRH